jgi:O-6-methylguanine DNA methyltransferase
MFKISTAQFLGHPFSIVYDDTHLIFSGFFSSADLPKEVIPLNPIPESETLAKEICAWYEEGDRQLPLPMNLKGTPFQKKIWNALSEIPKGSILKYKELAAAVDHPLAIRAAGTACGKNPLTLIVPCHRVLGMTSLGGYRWGLHIKEILLQVEGASL